jgi:hypothetical protein
VKRRGVSVRARTGYLADDAFFALPVPVHEAAALAALSVRPLPDDVPFLFRVLRLPRPDMPGRLGLFVAVPAGAMRATDVEGQQLADFQVYARIVDTRGRVVRKGSEHYRMSMSRGGDATFFRHPQLPPGRYTAEIAVYDAVSERAGARTIPLEVEPAPDSALVVSDLVIVQRAERAAEADRSVKTRWSSATCCSIPTSASPFQRVPTRH